MVQRECCQAVVDVHRSRQQLDSIVVGLKLMSSMHQAIEIAELVRELRANGVAGAIEVRWGAEPGTEEAEVTRRVRAALEVLQPAGGGDGGGGGGIGNTIRCNVHLGSTLFALEVLPQGTEAWRVLAQPNQRYRPKSSRATKQRRDTRPCSVALGADFEPEMQALAPLMGVDVDTLGSRLEGMPTVMGEWRRAARTAAASAGEAGVRQTTRDAPQTLPPLPAWVEHGEAPTVEALLALYAGPVEDQQLLKKGPVEDQQLLKRGPVEDQQLLKKNMFGFAQAEWDALIATACGPELPHSAVHGLHGGEAAAEQLLDSIFDDDASDPSSVLHAGGSAQGAGGGVSASTMLSAYLALGCTSARTVLARCQGRAEAEVCQLS
eukprot:SAG11_NODE_396_length_9806_cov_37.601855_7_plen_378_part_00